MAEILNAELTSPPPAVSPLENALQLQRRICLLRTTGQDAQAAHLERTDLPAALALARASADGSILSNLLAAEAQRVTDAVILADLLAPLLAVRLGPGAIRAAQPDHSAERSHPDPAWPPGLPLPRAASVADFIEGMLAQDRAHSRAERDAPRPGLPALPVPSR